MGYNYDQEWPIEPRGPKLPLLWRWSPDFTTCDAVQEWSEMVEITFYLLIQVTSSLFIILYDPSHSAARQIPQVRLIWNPDGHTFTDKNSLYISLDKIYKYQTSSETFHQKPSC